MSENIMNNIPAGMPFPVETPGADKCTALAYHALQQSGWIRSRRQQLMLYSTVQGALGIDLQTTDCLQLDHLLETY